MSFLVPNLGKETATEEFLLKKISLLHTKRRKLKEKKEEEELKKVEEKQKPATLSKQETILEAKRILQAEAAKKAEKEKNKSSGFKRSCKFERNRATRREIKARPLSLDDSPERPSKHPGLGQGVSSTSVSDKDLVSNFTYLDHDEAKGSGNLLAPMKADKGKYSNFVSSNSKRKLIQYDDALDIQ